jgi:hypothetical protein
MIPLTPSNIHDPLSFDLGDDWVIEVNCTDASGNPLDLTGAQIEWKLTRSSDKTVAALLTRDHGIVVASDTNASPTACTVLLPAADTALLIAGYYQDRLRVTTFDGIVTTQSFGRIDALNIA